MKKWILFLLLPLIAMTALSQEKYYLYNFVYATHIAGMPSELHAVVDDGESRYFLKDDKDKKIIFKTHASVLMYLESLGWEIFCFYGPEGGLSWDDLNNFLSESCVFWFVVRRPCTKEELDEAVRRGAYQIPVQFSVRKKRN